MTTSSTPPIRSTVDKRQIPVVVGVDGSDSGMRAVRWAAARAKLGKTRLRLVHACEVPVGYPGPRETLHRVITAGAIVSARGHHRPSLPGCADRRCCTHLMEVQRGGEHGVGGGHLVIIRLVTE